MTKTRYIVSPIGEIPTPIHEISDFSSVLNRLESKCNEADISVFGFDEPIEYEPGTSLYDEEILVIHPVYMIASKKLGYVAYDEDEKIWCISAPSEKFIECMEFGAEAEYREDCILDAIAVTKLVDSLLFDTPSEEYFYLDGRTQCDKRLKDWYKTKAV